MNRNVISRWGHVSAKQKALDSTVQWPPMNNGTTHISRSSNSIYTGDALIILCNKKYIIQNTAFR